MHDNVVPNEDYKVVYVFFMSLATVATVVSLGYRLRIGQLLQGKLHEMSEKHYHHENTVKRVTSMSGPSPDRLSQRLQPQQSEKLRSSVSQKLGSQNLRSTKRVRAGRAVISSLKKEASAEATGLIDFRKQAQKYEWELLQSIRTLTICGLTLLTILVQELPFTVLNCNSSRLCTAQSIPCANCANASLSFMCNCVKKKMQASWFSGLAIEIAWSWHPFSSQCCCSVR
jgi:hypothetical protein